MKEKIWNKEKHWFTIKFSLIFLFLAILFTILLILSMTVWGHNIALCLPFMFFALIFYSLFFAPIIKELY